MSDPMDDLLAQLQSSQPKASTAPPSAQPLQTPAAGSIDGLLDDLDEKPKRPVVQPAVKPRDAEGKPRDARVKPLSLPPDLPVAQPSAKRIAPTDSLLADIKTIYQAQDQAVALQQQAERAAEQRHQETLRQQRRGKVARQAETWLKNLDTESGEAAWFEEFAAKYSSRVEAAIDYLNLDTQ